MAVDSMRSLESQCDRDEGPRSGYGIYGAAFESLADHDFAFPGTVSHLYVTSEGYTPIWAPRVLVSCRSYEDAWEGGTISTEDEPSEHPRVVAIPAPSTESARDLPPSPWIAEVATRFAELLTLPRDWDGHGAGPVAPANVEAAGRFLAGVMAPSTPAPTIVPTSSGGLQVEWHRGGFDVELLFGDDESPLLYVAEVDSGREWEGSPIEGFAEFELAHRLGQ
jgi:hypothetical protein